jgi:hypothetical protein
MAGSIGGSEYYTRKNLKKNIRFIVVASIIVGVVFYVWSRL